MSKDPTYVAVIRTNKVDDNLLNTISSLKSQSIPPKNIVFVDSSGDQDVGKRLSRFGKVVIYLGEFNNSKAVNLGVQNVDAEFCLIISSHTVPSSPFLIEDGWNAALKYGADAMYWSPPSPGHRQPRRIEVIDSINFDGNNGLSNSFGMFRTEEATAYPFREDVFSAEDQEWANRYFHRYPDAKVVAIISPDVLYLRPVSSRPASIERYMRREVSLLLFTYRKSVVPVKLLALILRSILALGRGRRDRSKAHLGIVTKYLAHLIKIKVA